MMPHLQTITPEQRQVIDQLRSFTTTREMYLAGGTAVALHLGHRRSLDLDWFREDPLEDPMRLAQELRAEGIPFQTSVVERGTLHGEILGVRVSFLEYRYPLLEPADAISGINCNCAGLVDLAAMKLVAVAQRGSKKDFVDIYALGQDRLSFDQMLKAYRRKYSVTDTARLLYSLTYFDDADAEPMPKMLWDVDWDEMKRAILQWVKTAAE